jgi:hypothetical protein
MTIVKGTRHQKIIGDCGKSIICNWLSRSGFESAIVDHTGIDIIAFNPSTRQRIGIMVKSRTRTLGEEETSVIIFSKQHGKSDRQKVLSACEAFDCEPWMGVYVEATDQADIYLTSLANYDAKYCRAGKTIDDWKMGPKYHQKYAEDPLVKHIEIKFRETSWSW